MHNLITALLFWLCFFSSSYSYASNATQVTTKPVRAIHFVLRNIALEDAKHIADLAKANGFNTLIVTLADGVALDTFPNKLFANAWSKENLKSFVAYAKNHGLDVIPEIKLLSHQEKFLGNSHPELLYNNLTYDPQNAAVYKIVFPYLDEVIAIIQPLAIHIGHDEVIGWNKKHFRKNAGSKQNILPANLFLQDITKLHNYLTPKGIKIWMWGDMLLDPVEFPEVTDRNMHGSIPGYGKKIREAIPKDVVICDWHYGAEKSRLPSSKPTSFPSIAQFKKDGFQVLGATWKDSQTIQNFSAYAAKQNANGMIATTWFHVQKKEWHIVENIIKESGAIFQKDFPDLTLQKY